jgi:hypothetical protein
VITLAASVTTPEPRFSFVIGLALVALGTAQAEKNYFLALPAPPEAAGAAAGLPLNAAHLAITEV